MASTPSIDTHFTGDERVLKSTQSPYMAVRRSLIALQQHLAHIEERPIQVTADVKFHGVQSCTPDNGYYITIMDADQDAAAANIPRAATYSQSSLDAAPDLSVPGLSVPGLSAPGLSAPDLSTPTTSAHARRTSIRHSTDSGYHVDSDDDANEFRPPKKARLSTDDTSDTTTRGGSNNNSNELEAQPPRDADELLTTIQNWQRAWKAQGGWLYDTLSHIGSVAQQNTTGLRTQLNEVQDTIGESINAANALNVSEFEAIKRLIPWLEQCRKTEADRVRAAEERWRSTSANFRRQSQLERDAAQKRVEEGLEKQERMLLKIAEAVGVDLTDMND